MNELDMEKVNVLLEFCFASDNKFLDIFCIESLETK